MSIFLELTDPDFNFFKEICEGGCGNCQASCQSACKTTCVVANQECENEKFKKNN